MFNTPIGVVLTILRCISIPKADGEIKETAQRIEREIRASVKQDGKSSDFRAESKTEERRRKKEARKQGRSTGVVLSMLVCVLSFGLGILMLFGSFVNMASFGDFCQDVIRLVFPFMCISGASYLSALFFRRRNGRYNRIRALIGDNDSFSLVKIAAASREPLKKVRRDVQHLIDKGEFGDRAYIDLSTDNFMRYPEAEPDFVEGFDYRSVYDPEIFGRAEKDAAKKGRKNDREESGEKKETAEKPSDKDNFRSIILEIRRLNDEIQDFAVSERIYRIEEHTQHIFDYVTDHPEAMPQIRTFMNYYLPTTLKLLESYSRIERVGVAGENMKKSKENIESILDMLVVGFEQQVDQLFKNESIDISSDISVLETMMQKDGLSGRSDFRLDAESFSGEMSFGGAAAQKDTDEKDLPFGNS